MRSGARKGPMRPVHKSMSSASVAAEPAVEDDTGLDALAIARARTCERRGLDHVGVGIEGLVDLARGDVFAALDDQLLQAAGDEDVAVLIHAAEIAGAQPALQASAPRRSPPRS